MMAIRVRSLLWLTGGIVSAMVLLGSSMAWRADALPGTQESTIVNVTPRRILDTRDPNNIGLAGPFVSPVPQQLQVTGSIAMADGTMAVVPAGATGVLLNVTSVGSTADGFISVRPGDAVGAPTTSSLNFLAGTTTPNAVQVALPTTGPNAGTIEITFDALGSAGPTTDVLVDVVGYTTRTGLQDVSAELAKKANTADVYTKTQVDAGFVPQGEIVMSHATGQMAGPPGIVVQHSGGAIVSGDASPWMGLVGPSRMGAVGYGLKSIEYCIEVGTAPGTAMPNEVVVLGNNPFSLATDLTLRDSTGCYTVTVGLSGSGAYTVGWNVIGDSSTTMWITSLQSTWAPI